MDWISDNIQLVIIVGSTIAWWLTQNREKKAPPKDPLDRPGRKRIDFGEEDPEAARQVRERMRRLREQRDAGGASLAPPAPSRREPAREEIPQVLRELLGIPDEPPPSPPPPPLPVQPFVSPQQRLEAQMRELEAKRREADAVLEQTRGRMRAARSYGARPSRTVDLSEDDFLATLRDPRSVRRAILLREVLGKPVGLR